MAFSSSTNVWQLDKINTNGILHVKCVGDCIIGNRIIANWQIPVGKRITFFIDVYGICVDKNNTVSLEFEVSEWLF